MADIETVEVMEESTPLATRPIILNSRQSKFLASYQLTGNATESAINAGYSAKSAAIEGYRLLRNPKIIAELEQWKAKKLQTQLSKTDFIDIAMESFRKVEVTEPNSPRFLDIAAKVSGHIGNNGQSITNNTQINIRGDVNLMPLNNKWDALRSLMENE